MLPKRLKELRTNAKMSQKELAKKLFMSQQAVAKWETGAATPNPETLVKIAEIFGVTVDLLLSDSPISIFSDTSGSGLTPPKEGESPNVLEYRPTGTVPILGRIPAGLPLEAVEEVEGYEPVTVSDPENCFYLRVEGDSMAGAGIQTGDLVLIRLQPTADNGQIVACKVNGDEATLKRFRQQGDTVILMPENPKYDPLVVPASDFATGRAKIIGVAIEIKRKL